MSTTFKVTPEQHRMLTGTRGLAATWVVLAHMVFIGRYDAGFASREHWGGIVHILRFDFIGVDFFFVLSGCMLYLTYRKFFSRKNSSWDIDRFYLQRLGRIYPMYVFGIALMGLVYLLGILEALAAEEVGLFEHWQILVINLFMMTCWGIVPAASWNEPSWTVSAMAYVYVLFPNIVGILEKVPDKIRYNLLLIGVLLVALAFARCIPGWVSADGPGAMVRAFTLFVTGCLCGRLYQNGWGEKWNFRILFAAIFGVGFPAMLLAFYFKDHLEVLYSSLLFLPFYPVFMIGLLRGYGGVAYVLTNPVSQFLGKVSYSLYILHYPLLLLIKYMLGDALASVAQTSPVVALLLYPCVLAMVAGGAWVTTKYFEVPVFRWVKRKLKSRKDTDVAVP